MGAGDSAGKAVIIMGYRHTVESPRLHYPDAELWGQSNAARAWDFSLSDWSRWFDIHTERPQGAYAGIRLLRPDILAWYQKQGPERPIYFAEHIPSVRASTVYPIARIEARFGAGRFGCQLDYMLALALDEGFTRVIFYGVGQPYVETPDSEQARKWWQRHASVLYWMGRAEAMGVELVFDGPCINRPFDGRYGFQMGPD
jgi:hypothetical protein